MFQLYNHVKENYNPSFYDESVKMVQLKFDLHSSESISQFSSQSKSFMIAYPDVVSIKVLDVPPLYQVVANTQNELDEFTRKANEMISEITEKVEVTLEINKEILVTNFLQCAYSKNINIYFDSNITESLFSIDFKEFDSVVDDADISVFIINFDRQINISNNLVHITSAFESIKDLNSPNVDSEIHLIKKIRSERELNLKWVGGPMKLTPLHLYFEQHSIADEYILSVLNNMFASLAATYIACKTIFSDSKIDIYFESFKNTHFEIMKSEVISNDECLILYKLFRFIYSDDTTTKLNIFKNVISFHVGVDSRDTKRDFFRNLRKIFNVLKSNYNIYAIDKIKYWYDERRKIGDYISQKTDSISMQIELISRTLSSSVISFIGVIIGSLIPNITASKTGLLRAGLLLYLIVFIVLYLYNFSRSYLNYRNIILDFNEFIEIEEKILCEDEIQELLGSKLKRRKAQYWVYLIGTTIIAILILIGVYYLYHNLAWLETLLNLKTA